MKLRRLLLVGVVALAVAAPAHGAWRANEFVTPSGNIHCELWKLDTGAVVGMLCQLQHNRRTFLLPRASRVVELKGEYPPAITGRHVLQYGTTYRAGRFVCGSFTTELTCTNSVTGHGFSLSRERVRRW